LASVGEEEYYQILDDALADALEVYRRIQKPRRAGSGGAKVFM
jgi:hypothetical protein